MTSLCRLPVGLATGFGLWWREPNRRLLGIGALAGALLSGFALFQGMRAPGLVEYEVLMPKLPAALAARTAPAGCFIPGNTPLA